MKKVDWSRAPDWANAWAVDSDGKAFWHEQVPEAGDVEWLSNGRVEEDLEKPWDRTVEYRP